MNIINKIPLKKMIGLKKDKNEDKNGDKNGDYIHIDKIANVDVEKKTNMNMFKLVIILFLLYIFISTSLFKNSILGLFGKRFVNNGNSTCLGVVFQGIFLVLFYMLFATLINKGVI